MGSLVRLSCYQEVSRAIEGPTHLNTGKGRRHQLQTFLETGEACLPIQGLLSVGQGGGVVDWGQLGGSLVWEELPWHISTGTIDSLVSSRGLNK